MTFFAKPIKRLLQVLVLGIALTIANGGVAAVLTPELVVDRLEFTGVSQFEVSKIETTLEVGVGDPLERRKIVRTIQNLEDLYKTAGFDGTKVEAKFRRARTDGGTTEGILQFQVSEGRPIKVAEVVIHRKYATFDSYWKRTRPVLIRASKLNEGDILSEEKLSGSRRNLQDALAYDEFIGAQVDRVELVPVNSVAGQRDQKAKWVRVEITVDLGDRVTFGFRGNEIFTHSELLGFIEQQRLVGMGLDYLPVIRKKIESEYKSQGFWGVKVDVRTQELSEKELKLVTFVITEGHKFIIESVQFEGNIESNAKQLEHVFFDKASDRVNKRIYLEADVDKAAQLLAEWLRSRGYLTAKLVSVQKQFLGLDSSKNVQRVFIRISLYEGDQTRVDQIHLTGITQFSRQDVLAALKAAEGEPLDLYSLSDGLELLKQRYRNKGYLDAVFQESSTTSAVSYFDDNRKAVISVVVDEKFPARISKIEIEGLGDTEQSVVLHELQFKEGGLVTEPDLIESEERLRRLGIFSIALVKAVDEDNEPTGRKRIKVSLQEGQPGIVAGGVGYRTDFGPRLFGQVGYTNLWHRNHSIFLNGSLNRRFDLERSSYNRSFCASPSQYAADPTKDYCFIEYRFSLDYQWPWFMYPEVTYQPKLSVERVQYRLFDADTVRLLHSFERPILKYPNLVGGIQYSLERIRQYNATYVLEDERKYTIGSIGPAIKLDMRDSVLAPSKGLYSSISYEFAHPYLLSQTHPPVAYSIAQFRTDGFIPLPKTATLYLSVRTGIAYNLAPPPASVKGTRKEREYGVPNIKVFSLGGASSVRGFGEQEINSYSVLIQGYQSFVNYRSQVDLPFSGQMKFGPFLDAGNVYVDSYYPFDVRFGTGFGFHYQSPVGPINFDLGFKVKPRPKEDTYRFYFSVGVI